MNSIQKATTACIALAITLVGATLVTAPLALADVHRVAFHHAVSATYAQLDTRATVGPSSRQG